MKLRKQLLGYILFSMTVLVSCSPNKIEVSEGRLDAAEPDKDLRISSQVSANLSEVSKLNMNSEFIFSSTSGKKLVNSGKEILPYLIAHFGDSTKSAIYSVYNQRVLTIGEIAIIISDSILPCTSYRVIQIQQCTPPFDSNMEHFLYAVQKDPVGFRERYVSFLKESKK